MSIGELSTSGSLLATGGLTAAVVAGWNQVKNMFSYLSSFIIVQVDLDYTLSGAVRVYLRTEYKAAPTGMLNYVQRKLPFKSKNVTRIVPFLTLPKRTIFFKKGHVLFVNGSHDQMHICAIRGTVNFNKLISNAIDLYETRTDSHARTSRYQVEKVIGSEKGFSALSRNNNHGEVADKAMSDDSPAPSFTSPDLSTDISFKYDKDLYTITDEDDPFDGLYFSNDVLKYFDQAQQWYDMGPWYAERRIPWRRGWLMHGRGGTGKSSIARAVAQKLGIPIYQFYLGTLSDQEFMRKWENMRTPCVALFEDFDAIFNKRESLTEHKSLTFDCVLNQISGVSAMNGVFLMITTNKLDHIDEAMGVSCGLDGISTRPGRIDTVIEVGMINKENRQKMAERILKDWPEVIDSVVNADSSQDITPIQFQEMCIQIAYKRLALEMQC